ncbi:ABC transporter permease [Nocardioides luteus]|uniref:ABC transporter permease n=1 Tax=Nocardioides luteus TaxID=1844 RepID=UPI0018CB25FA|nr:ABC transporter permease [Nocardioides luteus]MBG6096990.1 ABC-2 type transport system permease protein [Nocardioides luteus]
MTAITIAWTNLRRSLKDRTNAFFFVLFPLLMITVLGIAFGGDYEPRVGVAQPAAGALSGDLVAALEDAEGIDVRRFESRAEAVEAVEEGGLEAAVVVPEAYDDRVEGGRDTTVEYLSRSDRSAQQIGMIVRAVVDDQAGRYRVARTLQHELGGEFRANLVRGDAFAGRVADVAVSTTTVGSAPLPEDLGRFDLGASSQLLLFTFVTSMTTAASLIETRRLGVARRMFATPTRVATIVAGEALGRIAIAVVQGLVIMIGAALLFGVSWGAPIAAALMMLLFATVAGGAGMVLGAAATNAQQSTAVGLLAGLGISALGGSMMPLEFYSPTMLTIAHLTPHAWAADGFATLVRHDGTVLDVLPQLGVLAGFAAALFGIGSWALRRRILTG